MIGLPCNTTDQCGDFSACTYGSDLRIFPECICNPGFNSTNGANCTGMLEERRREEKRGEERTEMVGDILN